MDSKTCLKNVRSNGESFINNLQPTTHKNNQQPSSATQQSMLKSRYFRNFDVFDRQEKHWYKWSRKFLDHAKIEGYLHVLEGNTIIPKSDEKITNNKITKYTNKIDNERAYAYMFPDCDDDISFGCIDGSMTDSTPTGNSRISWKKLQPRFQPTMDALMIEMKRGFNKNKLRNKQDPDEWIMLLKSISYKLKNTHKYEIETEDMLIHMINNLTLDYEYIIIHFKNQLTDKLNPLTWESMNSQLKAKHRRMYLENRNNNINNNYNDKKMNVGFTYNKKLKVCVNSVEKQAISELTAVLMRKTRTEDLRGSNTVSPMQTKPARILESGVISLKHVSREKSITPLRSYQKWASK